MIRHTFLDTQAKSKPLDIVRWTAAFECYALAAHACGVRLSLNSNCARERILSLALQVWTYASAKAHLQTCLQIAATSAAEGRLHSLAILYDKLCRKEWNEKATRGTAPGCLGLIFLPDSGVPHCRRR